MQVIMASLLSIDLVPQEYYENIIDDTLKEDIGFPPMKKVDEIS